MPIKLNGATSGSIELDVPAAVGSDLQVTLPATAGDVVVKAADGSVNLGSVDIDSSGRLLVGTSSTSANTRIVAVGNSFGGNGRIDIDCDTATPADGDGLGYLVFGDSGQSNGAWVGAERDSGTWSGSSKPSRLVFSTTANGAISATQRMVIDSNGTVGIGQPNNNVVRLALTGQTSDNTAYTFAYYNTFGTTLHYTRNDGVLCTGLASLSPYNNTTGAGANVHVGGDGVLYRSTSSIRFKTNIESLEDSYADAILNIKPVWYRSTAPGDEVHPDWSYYGFIAEDVAKVDPRLVFWKTHEAGQDEEGKPTFTALDEPIAEGVQYDRFVPHLLSLIKRQKEQIESQGSSIAALEARITALEVTP